MEYNIYLDLYFLVNFIMDLLLLSGCRKFLQFHMKTGNAVLAAVFGAVSACFMLMIHGNGLLSQLVISLGMERIACGKERIPVLLKRALLLFFLAFF